MADIHQVAIEPQGWVRVDLQAALGEPGLVLIRPADIDLIRYVALAADAAMADDHAQDGFASGIHHL